MKSETVRDLVESLRTPLEWKTDDGMQIHRIQTKDRKDAADAIERLTRELNAAEAALAAGREVTPAMVHAFMATYQDHSLEYVYNAVEAGLKAALAALPAPEVKP